MLSDNGILREIKKGSLKIRPFDKQALRPSGYTFHLGPHFLVPKAGFKINPLTDDPSKFYSPLTASEKRPLVLEPGDFVLGETLEEIALSPKIGAFVDGASTIARLGISIHQAAMMLDPGHGWPNFRRVTLEIKNDGTNSIVLTPGMKFCKAAFFKLEPPASFSADERSKYNKQKNVGAPLRIKEKGV